MLKRRHGLPEYGDDDLLFQLGRWIRLAAMRVFQMDIPSEMIVPYVLMWSINMRAGTGNKLKFRDTITSGRRAHLSFSSMIRNSPD
jgi:hypothetical protein